MLKRKSQKINPGGPGLEKWEFYEEKMNKKKITLESYLGLEMSFQIENE